MTTITFVRHGNTDWNNEKRAQGHSNNPLNETGKKQAKALAYRLAQSDEWDLFISSDLLRAKQTAEIISNQIEKPIAFYDKRLWEIGRGKIQGTIEAERIEKWGEEWRQLDLGVEKKEALRKRGVDFAEGMAKKYPEMHLLVVSHGLLIEETVKGLLRDETIAEKLENTSVTTVQKESNAWSCSRCNCTLHLDGIAL